jgi:tetratricopeptide (TPR) repeat protein
MKVSTSVQVSIVLALTTLQCFDEAWSADLPLNVADGIRTISRTHQMIRRDDKISRDIAKSILDVEEDLQPKHNRDILAFRYYFAEAAARAGDFDRAAAISRELAIEKDGLNAPDAAALLQRIARDDLAVADPSKSVSGVARSTVLAGFYPAGFYADRLLEQAAAERYEETVERHRQRNEPMLGIQPPFSPFPKADVFKAQAAASLYGDMAMYQECAEAYRCAVGFLPAHEWVSPRAKQLWLGMGNAYMAMGKWDGAWECYLKSLASGGSAKELVDRVAEARSSASAGKAELQVVAQPTAETLLKIAELLRDTDLFLEARKALSAAEKIRPGIGSELRLSIDAAERKRIGDYITGYGEGGLFRGIPVTKEHLRELAR